MDTQTTYSPAVCLRLIDDQTTTTSHHCSLCAFFLDTQNSCQHIATAATTTPILLRTATPFSECSFYTALSDISPTSDSEEDEQQSLSSRSSTSTIRATTPCSLRRQPLRRTSSPTERSLRDLHREQAAETVLRQQQSEERLQRIYELQILAYLNAGYADLKSIDE